MSVDGETLSAITGMEEACATARARVEDLVAELDDLRRCLRSVIAQRNEAQARVVDAALIHAELVRERDEARTELATLADALDDIRHQRDRYHVELKQERQEVERLRTALLEVQTAESAPAWFADGFRDGWKAGAEAMREACARWMSEREGISQWVYDDALSALPIPEEPT